MRTLSGKQTRMSLIESQLGSTYRVLELVHMDIMGPIQVENIIGKMYVYVCVDDFSKFTLTNFLRAKLEAFEASKELWLGLSKEQHNRLLKITKIRSDHGKEFKNSSFTSFYGKNGMEHEFSAPKTP